MHWIVQTMNIFKSHVNFYLSRNLNIFFSFKHVLSVYNFSDRVFRPIDQN